MREELVLQTLDQASDSELESVVSTALRCVSSCTGGISGLGLEATCLGWA